MDKLKDYVLRHVYYRVRHRTCNYVETSERVRVEELVRDLVWERDWDRVVITARAKAFEEMNG